MKKVLFLGQLPENFSPSQRFRIEQYKYVLEKASVAYYFQPFIAEKYAPFIYRKGYLLKKVAAVVDGFWRRLTGLYRYRNVDYVFVQREASPLGPPVFEWLWAKVLYKKLIYDFDDSIWIPNTSEGNSLAARFKCFWKVAKICSWAWKVSVGNAFLASFAKKYNDDVVLNPTCVNTLHKYNRTVEQKEGKVVIGWTGSHSTLPFLETLSPTLQKLAAKIEFTCLVICDRQPEFPLPNMQFVKWNKHSEIEDLLRIHIGIMPLKMDVWAKGKCGFKIIQYMALGIPAVATKVGVNDTIIDEGENGYTCSTEEEWINALTALITDAGKRKEMGLKGQKKIRNVYSVQANSAVFLSLFDVVCKPATLPVYERKT